MDTAEEDGDPEIAGRDLKKVMWTVGFRYRWRKTEVAAEDRAGW